MAKASGWWWTLARFFVIIIVLWALDSLPQDSIGTIIWVGIIVILSFAGIRTKIWGFLKQLWSTRNQQEFTQVFQDVVRQFSSDEQAKQSQSTRTDWWDDVLFSETMQSHTEHDIYYTDQQQEKDDLVDTANPFSLDGK